ncbi:hypothetical protein JCGZ_19423 [Jatropha curcas]|uniref:GATA-type domain-containing protein n=1 Tax=Jatropha curcas TaxID=180498 RepID=A0A067LB01_JATCU|nr:hypothetical protein JCGZ_19423 [Jatropha curcas]
MMMMGGGRAATNNYGMGGGNYGMRGGGAAANNYGMEGGNYGMRGGGAGTNNYGIRGGNYGMTGGRLATNNYEMGGGRAAINNYGIGGGGVVTNNYGIGEGGAAINHYGMINRTGNAASTSGILRHYQQYATGIPAYQNINGGLTLPPFQPHSLTSYTLLDYSPFKPHQTGKPSSVARRPRNGNNVNPHRRCTNCNCNTNDTPMWRKGPLGPKGKQEGRHSSNCVLFTAFLYLNLSFAALVSLTLNDVSGFKLTFKIRLGHRSEVCPDSAVEVVKVNKEFGGSQDKAMQESGLNVQNSNDGFGPWMVSQHRPHRNFKKISTSSAKDHSRYDKSIAGFFKFAVGSFFSSYCFGGFVVLAEPSFAGVGLEDKDLGVGRFVRTEPKSAIMPKLDSLLRPNGGLRPGLVVCSEGSIGVGLPSGQRELKPPDLQTVANLLTLLQAQFVGDGSGAPAVTCVDIANSSSDEDGDVSAEKDDAVVGH